MKIHIYKIIIVYFFLCVITATSFAQNSAPFNSLNFNEEKDLSVIIVEQVDSLLTDRTEQFKQNRNNLWHHDFNSVEAFKKSISSERELLEERLGVVEQRVEKPAMKVLTNNRNLLPLEVKKNDHIIRAVRWNVLDGLTAEGLLIQPKGKVRARIILIPDADVHPEVFAGINEDGNGTIYGIARQFANIGWEVLIPTLINRDDTFSGNSSLNLFTNQPHREWIYRQAYEVGRHVIGYELQKIFSAIDWFEKQNRIDDDKVLIGVAGYGEGGLLALHASALDDRISSTLVSGYFDAREQLWSEPIYRNVFGKLEKFGDAELAVMTWPRSLIIEHSIGPKVLGPPDASKGRRGAAPGSLSTPNYSSAKAEWDRVRSILKAEWNNFHWYANGNSAFKQPFSNVSVTAFAKGLNVTLPSNFYTSLHSINVSDWVDIQERQKRTVREMERHVQRVLDVSARVRDKNYWNSLKGDTTKQRHVKEDLREKFWEQIGRLPTPSIPANPRSRLIEKTEAWTSYDIKLDVWPGVLAWGILLLPNDLKAEEKRPVVVTQHGLEGVPADVVTTDSDSQEYSVYKGFASRLADRGYVVFAPFNLYRGGDKFRVLQRKANPIGLTLFSIIIGQHQRIVEWLQEQTFVDSERIGFYGLSYGGKTAMRVPAVIEDYALSICSADFNEWVRKCATTDYSFSYMFTGEYDMYEWDLAHTFNYAEMAGLIAPRPFMVERGHFDGVGKDEWVGFEFEKVRRHYNLLNLPESVRIEYFNGPHTINGVGTFEFLDQHLKK